MAPPQDGLPVWAERSVPTAQFLLYAGVQPASRAGENKGSVVGLPSGSINVSHIAPLCHAEWATPDRGAVRHLLVPYPIDSITHLAA